MQLHTILHKTCWRHIVISAMYEVAARCLLQWICCV